MKVSVALGVWTLLAASIWPCAESMYGKWPALEDTSSEGSWSLSVPGRSRRDQILQLDRRPMLWGQEDLSQYTEAIWGGGARCRDHLMWGTEVTGTIWGWGVQGSGTIWGQCRRALTPGCDPWCWGARKSLPQPIRVAVIHAPQAFPQFLSHLRHDLMLDWNDCNVVGKKNEARSPDFLYVHVHVPFESIFKLSELFFSLGKDLPDNPI